MDWDVKSPPDGRMAVQGGGGIHAGAWDEASRPAEYRQRQGGVARPVNPEGGVAVA